MCSTVSTQYSTTWIVDHRLPNCWPPRIQENTDMNRCVQVKFYNKEKRSLLYTVFRWFVLGWTMNLITLTNFWGWLNFMVFGGTSQTAKNNPSEIFVRLCPCRNTHCHWARQAREWCSFVTFVQPLTTEERNSLCCFPLSSLVHWSTSTIAQLIQKGVW